MHGSTVVYKAVKPPSTILFLSSDQRICAPFVLFRMELLLQEPHACLGSHCLYCSATGRLILDGLPVFPWMPGSTSPAWLWFPPRCRTTSASGGGGGVWLPTESQHIKLLKLQAVFLVLRHFLSLIQGRCAGENQQLHHYSVHQQAGRLTVRCEFQTSKHLKLSRNVPIQVNYTHLFTVFCKDT